MKSEVDGEYKITSNINRCVFMSGYIKFGIESRKYKAEQILKTINIMHTLP